jgi:hypothetical protein
MFQSHYMALDTGFLSTYPDFPPEMTLLGQFVFLRTYSRYLKKEGRRETFKETILRATNYNINLIVEHYKNIGYQLDPVLLQKEAHMLFDNMFHLRQFVSGRTLWIGGTQASQKYSLSNFNCAGLNITKWEDFCDLFYLLMVGTGVGFKSNQQLLSGMGGIRGNVGLIHSAYHPLSKAERLEQTEFHLLHNGYAKIYVGDSKEGWVESLRCYLRLLTQKEYEYIHTIKISYNSVRPQGERLNTFGGTASGPKPLQEMFDGINKTLKNQLDPWLEPLKSDEKGYVHLRPIHIMDIGNLIGQNVVVGGVRRCLPAGSMVHLKRGLIPIEKVQKGDQVLTTKGYKVVTDWFEQGERDLVTIKTVDCDFVCTENHRMPVLTSSNTYKWVEASKLKQGDKLISSRTPIDGVKTSLPASDNPSITVPELDEKMAWFIGLFNHSVEHAGYTDRGIVVHHPTQIVIDQIAQQMRRFGVSVVYHEGYVECKLHDYLCNNITRERVPEWIFCATNSVKLAYIAGIIDGHHGDILLRTNYVESARDVQRLLYSCGIESRLISEKQHSLHLVSTHSINKINRVHQLHKTLVTDSGDDSVDEPEKEEMCPVEVVSVTPCGRGYTYDITVDGPNESEGVHEFFVNGLLSHNTAEMFIFEEHDYEVLFAKYGINGLHTQDQYQHHLKLGQDLDKFGIKPKWFDQLTKRFELDGKALRGGLDHRRMSNNSIMFNQRPTLDYLRLLIRILRYEGEPGLINMQEMKRRRPNAELINPCAEVLLDTYQTCNLTTVNLTQFIDHATHSLRIDELLEAQKLSVRAGLRMTLVNLELPHWDSKQKRDRLIGTSLTGIKDTIDYLNYTKEQEYALMQKLGDVARQEAVRYAHEIRVPAPLLVTTIKPEGSLSQMVGCVSQGLHLSHAPYFIRRIRINADDPMVSVIKHGNWVINPEVGTMGLTHEERMNNARTYVIDFPVESHAKKTKDQTTIEEQLETYFNYQRLYTDHNCSNTITVKDHEWDKLPQLIYDHWDQYIGITFMPLDGGKYELAPYEACTELEYRQLKTSMKPFDVLLLNYHDRKLQDGSSETDENESIALPADSTQQSECAGGVCPWR